MRTARPGAQPSSEPHAPGVQSSWEPHAPGAQPSSEPHAPGVQRRASRTRTARGQHERPETYCLDCHSVTSTNRHGAPGDLNFDTEADIKKHAEAIDEEAAAGPDATNTSMPELSANVTMKPSLEELLGQFLACERAR